MVGKDTSRSKTPFKRLCVFSDGSWNHPEMEIPTNILNLTKAVKPCCSAGVHQLVFYDAGVGTGGSFDSFSGGAFGAGIDKNIQELYSFLALNYSPGDEIYLYGFSRGAYTVRSLAGFIYEAGLVGRDDLDFVKEAYDLYRSPVDPESDEAKAFRAAHGDRVPITLLACFDTVGALGLPYEPIWPLSTMINSKQYRFHNTTLSPVIEHAIHLLAIDEDRKAFLPTRMTACAERGLKQVTEVFLPGNHSGVGGGSKVGIPYAQNALRFLVDEMARRGLGLELEMEKIPKGGDVYQEPTIPSSSDRLYYGTMKFFTGTGYRTVESVKQLHESTVERYCKVPKWRPPALEKIGKLILDAGSRRA